MKTNIVQYLKEFWSPEKLVLAFLLFASWFVGRFSTVYYTHCNYVPENLIRLNCETSYIDIFIRPFSMASFELNIFFLSLLLLPLTLLHNWFKYIASWSIPAGLLIYWSGVPTSPGTGSMFAPAFNASAMMGTAVSFWLILLAGFVAFSIGKQIWNKLKSK